MLNPALTPEGLAGPTNSGKMWRGGPMSKDWTLGLIDSAWFGTDFEGKRGREEAKRIGFESLDLFVGFDPGKLTKVERQAYIDENLSTGLPVVSLVCTCLGLSDFNPAIRGYHIERAKNVVDLAADFP